MKKGLTFLLFLAIQLGFAQYNEMVPWQQGVDKNNTNAFEQLENNYQKYFSTHNELEKGSGMKQYQRWKYIWKDYFLSKGFKPISTVDRAFQLKQAMARSTQDNSQWSNVGPTIVNRHGSSADKGRVNFVLIDPTDNQIMYVGTPAGGIWKSTNAGVDWTPLSDHLPQIGVSAIALSPTDHNTIFIGTGDDDGSVTYSRGVYKSTDGGTTWLPIGPVFASESELINEIVIDPGNSNIILVASSDGVYKTTNGGATWIKTLAHTAKEMRMHPTNSGIVYVVSRNTFYKSTNGGDSFTEITGGLPANSLRMVIDVTPAAPNKVYVATADRRGNFSGLYISNNSGASFTQTQENDNVFGRRNQTSYDFALAVSNTDPNKIFIGNIDIWSSSDGGNNFSQLNYWNTVNSQYTHADIHFLRYYNGKLVAGTDGGVYVSSNDGQLFTGLNQHLAISQFYRIAISQSPDYQIYGGLQDNGGFARKNMGWHVWHGADGMDTAISGQDSDIGYSFIYYGFAMHITTNGGITETAGVGAPAGERGNWITPLRTNALNEVYAGFKKIYKLQNSRWQAVTSSAFSSNISTFTIDRNNTNHILAAVDNELYQSNDGGTTFIPIYTSLANIKSIEINSIANKIWIVTSDQVLESNNNGNSFNDITGNLPSEKKRIIKYHKFSPNNSLYLGTDLGVYYKDDLNANWQIFSQNLPNTVVTDLEINNPQGILVAATHGRGIWETPIPVYSPDKDAAIENISLGQNHIIECGATSQDVTARVYNRGNDNITQMTINFTIDGVSNNINWNGNLSSNNYADIVVSNINLSMGVHEINCTVNLVGDQIMNNNQYSKNIIINQEKTLPYSNGFETQNTDLLINYSSGISTWEMATPSGNNLNQTGSGTKAYCTNSGGNYIDNNKDYLYSPCFNFTNFINPNISFDLAFDIEQDWDAFYIEYTTDNGTSWQILGNSSDANWYNNNTVQGTCLGNQWSGSNTTVTNYNHDLSFLTNEPSVIFRFVMASDQNLNQEGVMLDNILITGTMSVDKNNLENSVMVYPNPANNNANIKWHTDLSVKAIAIYNVQGSMIYHKNISLQGNQMQINTSNFAKGMYFINMLTDQNRIVKKLIVK